MTKFVALIIISCLAVTACKNDSTSTSTSETAAVVESISLEKIWETDTLLTTAESVLYDESRGIYYVSCMGAVPPWDNDGDGFIAKVDESGNILEQKWVTGLSAPKGMGKVGDILYVNDNDRLVSIDLEKGEIIKRMPIKEAKNLNDVSIGASGEVYLSDSYTSTAYKVVGDEVTVMIHDTIIGGLNGIFYNGDNLIFTGFGTGNLFTFEPDSKKLTAVSDSMMKGDGIEKYGDGFFISSWDGEIYHLDKDWNRETILTTKHEDVNSADIEIVESKQLLLVPTFFDNRVMAYKIHGK